MLVFSCFTGGVRGWDGVFWCSVDSVFWLFGVMLSSDVSFPLALYDFTILLMGI